MNVHKPEIQSRAGANSAPGCRVFPAVLLPALLAALMFSGCPDDQIFGYVNTTIEPAPASPAAVMPVLGAPSSPQNNYARYAIPAYVTVRITNRDELLAQAGMNRDLRWQWYVTQSPNPDPDHDTALLKSWGEVQTDGDLTRCRSEDIPTSTAGIFYYYVAVINRITIDGVPLIARAVSRLYTVTVDISISP